MTEWQGPSVAWPIVALLCVVTLIYILRERRYRQLIKNLYMQAITDGLTGLSNHTHFLGRLQEEVDRAGRYRHPLSLLMIDLDHFKSYNDTFGHQHGDELLRQIAHVLRTSLRRVDMTARYGGEEFVVILPETNLEGAIVVAERLRSRISEMVVAKRQVTVSVGVSATGGGDGALSPSLLLRLADEAMYESKNGGRNTVRSKAAISTPVRS